MKVAVFPRDGASLTPDDKNASWLLGKEVVGGGLWFCDLSLLSLAPRGEAWVTVGGLREPGVCCT